MLPPVCLSLSFFSSRCRRSHRIRRFNVCTGAFLPDFATAPAESTSLRILPDGGLLVGRIDATDRYTAAGTIAQSYPLRGAGAIGLEGDGGSALIAQRCANQLVALNLATGGVTHVATIDDGPLGVVAYRGWTAALGASHAADVPSLSAMALVFLGALLAFAAFARLR